MSSHKKKLFILSALILVALLVTGCTAKQVKKPEVPEVLLAHDCGMDKLQCCKTQPVCLYSQKCCTDPNNATRNYCSDECTCGGKGEFCCKDAPKCGQGLACNDGICSECGKADEICCSENKCSDQEKLDETRTECLNGTCVQCGANGNPCSGELKCISGYINNNGVCYQCGETNEPCCTGNSGKKYECNPAKYLKCYQGFCLE